jgi:LuxR family maltose regulon positive regulatory protein
VSDFLRQQKNPFFWLTFTELDNSTSHLWKNTTDSIQSINPELAGKFTQIGFPDTVEKMKMLDGYKNSILGSKPYIIVYDDFHFVKEPEVLQFIIRLINSLASNFTLFLICRDIPRINIETLQIKGLSSEITETELNFNENELISCLKQHEIQGVNGVPLDSRTIREIHKDTGGWALAVNLVARSLRRVPKYTGFVKTTLKPNIFEFMESENWETLSEQLKNFLLHLSLVDHISVELVDILSGGDEGLLSELRQQSAYIRYDSYGGAYIIHHMYLDFLRTKHDNLENGEKIKTYTAAADWCARNNFKIDALNYYEKVGDYKSIVAILWGEFGHMSYDVCVYAAEIFKRAPREVFGSVDFFMSAHLLCLLCLYNQHEFIKSAREYEKKLLLMPESDFKNRTLGGVYFFWGCMRFLISTDDDDYDFNRFFLKATDYLTKSTADINLVIPVGSWCSAVGSSRAGVPLEFTKAVSKMTEYSSPFINDTNGFDCLCRGELKFYQNDIRGAEPLLFQAVKFAREHGQFEIIHRALFYIKRISVMQGDRIKAEQTLEALQALLNEEGYSRRNVTYDIALGWYYCVIRQYDMLPDWLKSEFTFYRHSYHLEYFSNQIRARYYYLKRNYLPLLAYIEGMKRRESILFGRVEMLAMEACVHYQMKNKAKAFTTLRQAYETAYPNDIITPFVELGKDMRTLTISALREGNFAGIPRVWLESVRNKASSYAKCQSIFVAEQKLNDTEVNKVLSSREQDVLSDLYHGFSQSEIARKHSLSINTVKMVTKSIYEKLHVHKISDLIRIAAEQRLV